MLPMKIAAIYVRQSSTQGNDKDVSPEEQEAACRKLPEVAACEVVEVYRDLNRSGQDETREQFAQFMARIESGKISVVAAYDGDRIARETELASRFFKLVMRQSDTTCVLVEGRYETSPSGEFDWTLQRAFGRKYAREAGLKLSRSHTYRREQGYATGPAPYGYRYDRRGNEKWPLLIPDPETAPVLQRIFSTYAEAAPTARPIAQPLKPQAIPAPATNPHTP